MAKKLPEANNASLADIAFMLLIFFLVTTTMSTDKGIPRVLPPYQENPEENEVRERNVFKILINSYNQVSIEGEAFPDLSLIKEAVKKFFINRDDDPDLSEKKWVEDLPLLGPKWPISKGVVSLQNDRSTEYQVYLEVQDQVVAAINELRDNLAQEKWGVNYEELGAKSAKRAAVKSAFPMALSEAVPRDLSTQK